MGFGLALPGLRAVSEVPQTVIAYSQAFISSICLWRFSVRVVLVFQPKATGLIAVP